MNDKPWPAFWLDKPYYSFNAYCRHVFHEKLYKIAIDAGMTCPNRDGTLGSRGCIFCSAGGSGDFAVRSCLTEPQAPEAQTVSIVRTIPISEQIRQGLSLFRGKQTGSRFIAYYQAYTNTYAPASRLRTLYTQALDAPEIAGISIATRPDCLGPDVMALLTELQTAYPGKFIWVELGLQTIHEQTAAYIRRGYPLSCFTRSAETLAKAGIPYIVHIILGLPGETDRHIYETIGFLNQLPLAGIKLQLLHVLQNTDLAADYAQGIFRTLELTDYVDLIIGCLERLRPDIVVHRITGDGPKNLLIAPKWSADKRNVCNTIHRELCFRNTWQGKEL